MKTKILIILIMLIAIKIIPAQQKPILTVLDFKTGSISSVEMRSVISQLSGELYKTGKYRIIDASQRDMLLGELEFSMSDCTDKACQLQAGKLLTAEYIVTGEIDRVGSRISFACKILLTETGRLAGNYNNLFSNFDKLFDSMPLAAAELSGGRSRTAAKSDKKPKLKDGFVLVEGGSFMMGSNNGDDDEKPVHQVTVGSFYMSKYEVTQELYEEVMGKNPSYFKGSRRPVESISWYDAVEFCNALSLQQGLTPCYTGSGDNIRCNFKANGYRLPTEAEWEYAARGGQKSRGYKYAGSNNINKVAEYKENTDKATKPVGGKKPNELGLYDMSGNVWEWCWDWYGDYNIGGQTEPRGASSGIGRILRGGGYDGSASDCRVAFRNIKCVPTGYYYSFGFRLVRAAQ